MAHVKKILALLGVMYLTILHGVMAGDTVYLRPAPIIYTLAFNTVPDNVHIPMVGFVNVARGDHKSADIGFINVTGGRSKGAQIGYVNVVGESVKGVQAGFVNVTSDTINGAQLGFVNISGSYSKGLQTGFVNISPRHRGLQLGFVNIADSLSGGFPLGFVSIVRKGGYGVLELSLSEYYPINVAVKFGVPHLYTGISISIHPQFLERTARGLLIGGFIPLNSFISINPEYRFMSYTRGDPGKIHTLMGCFDMTLDRGFSIAIGPTFSWHRSVNDTDIFAPFIRFYSREKDASQRFDIGARFALRYRLY